MKAQKQILILGVGSAHGDDCIGWRVVDQLRERGVAEAYLGRLATPVQLVARLGEAKQVHLVDAAAGLAPGENVRRLEDTDQLEGLATLGTHGMGICESLQLAGSIGYPVDHVVIWLAKGESFEPLGQPSPTAVVSTEQCVTAILGELEDLKLPVDPSR